MSRFIILAISLITIIYLNSVAQCREPLKTEQRPISATHDERPKPQSTVKDKIKKLEDKKSNLTSKGGKDRLQQIEDKARSNQRKLVEEFKGYFGKLKDNCFPRPNKGCRCVEKDPAGREVVNFYEPKDREIKCNVPAPHASKVTGARHH